nr:hypothetical protein [Mycoplasmopsis bovis]
MCLKNANNNMIILKWLKRTSSEQDLEIYYSQSKINNIKYVQY